MSRCIICNWNGDIDGRVRTADGSWNRMVDWEMCLDCSKHIEMTVNYHDVLDEAHSDASGSPDVDLGERFEEEPLPSWPNPEVPLLEHPWSSGDEDTESD